MVLPELVTLVGTRGYQSCSVVVTYYTTPALVNCFMLRYNYDLVLELVWKTPRKCILIASLLARFCFFCLVAIFTQMVAHWWLALR